MHHLQLQPAFVAAFGQQRVGNFRRVQGWPGTNYYDFMATFWRQPEPENGQNLQPTCAGFYPSRSEMLSVYSTSISRTPSRQTTTSTSGLNLCLSCRTPSAYDMGVEVESPQSRWPRLSWQHHPTASLVANASR
jgi:hypothetical protein